MTDGVCHVERLAIMLLSIRDFAGIRLGIGEVARADGYVHALGCEAAVQFERLAVGGNGGGVILF